MKKYRALRTDNHEWTYFTETYYRPYRFIPSEREFKHPVDISTLSRYVGRKDRHGILIFGGDYVQDGDEIYRICFVEGMPRIYDKKHGYQDIDKLDFEFCKVIGNRYEHKK